MMKFTDRVTLIKSDGIINRENIPAIVQSKLIFIKDETVPLEVGDHLLRKLPNGNVEDFVVNDPVFYDTEFGGIKSHFQVKVSRNGNPSNQGNVIQNITNNFEGANSRVNIQSTDNSVNISEIISSKQLRQFIDEVSPSIHLLPEEQREIVERELKTLRKEVEKDEPSQMKTRTALQSIKSVAEGAAGNLVATGILGLIADLL